MYRYVSSRSPLFFLQDVMHFKGPQSASAISDDIEIIDIAW